MVRVTQYTGVQTMMTPEGKVKAKVKAVLDKRGVYYFMPRGTAFGRAGVPDIICCINGRFLAIECKANGNKPSALLVALFFYFYWSNVKVQEHATLNSWLKNGVIGAVITFIASEIIVGISSQLDGSEAFIGQDSMDILVFSLYNATIGFAIIFTLFSAILQLLSKNAKNIPFKFYQV